MQFKPLQRNPNDYKISITPKFSKPVEKGQITKPYFMLSAEMVSITLIMGGMRLKALFKEVFTKAWQILSNEYLIASVAAGSAQLKNLAFRKSEKL